jgi:hypothetical protein
MINKIKNRWMAGRGRKLCSALLLAALPLGSAWAANNDMAFTAKIKPWGTSSFDFTILNETLEPITAITVSHGWHRPQVRVPLCGVADAALRACWSRPM